LTYDRKHRTWADAIGNVFDKLTEDTNDLFLSLHKITRHRQ